MDDKQILALFKNYKANSGIESGHLNKTEMPSILQKNKRRSKKDKTGRNFKCGCGKTYLSYPALYTHIKNKHGGENPPGTTLQPQSRVKPGRPPKPANSVSKHDGMYSASRGDGQGNGENGNGDDDGEDGDGDSQGMSDRGSRSRFGDGTPTKFQGGEMGNSFEKQRNYTFHKDMFSQEDLGLAKRVSCIKISHEKTSPAKTFVKEKNFITNQFILHPVSQYLNLMKEDCLPDNFFLTTPTCDKLFAIYLYNMSLQTNQSFTDMLAVLLRAMRDFLNKYGYELLQKFESQNPMQKVELQNKQPTNSQEFCQLEPPWYISVTFDYFVKKFLPEYLEDESNFSLPFVCLFLKEFNSWLLKHNLTRLKCSFFSFHI